MAAARLHKTSGPMTIEGAATVNSRITLRPSSTLAARPHAGRSVHSAMINLIGGRCRTARLLALERGAPCHDYGKGSPGPGARVGSYVHRGPSRTPGRRKTLAADRLLKDLCRRRSQPVHRLRVKSMYVWNLQAQGELPFRSEHGALSVLYLSKQHGPRPNGAYMGVGPSGSPTGFVVDHSEIGFRADSRLDRILPQGKFARGGAWGWPVRSTRSRCRPIELFLQAMMVKFRLHPLQDAQGASSFRAPVKQLLVEQYRGAGAQGAVIVD